MITLYDRSNRRAISRHRTMEAAVRADRKLQRAVRRANGATSYLDTQYLHADGTAVDMTADDVQRMLYRVQYG